MGTSTRISPIMAHVRALDGEYYTLSEVAAQLGVHPRSLRVLNAEHFDTLGPSYTAKFGKVRVYLYVPDDIAKLKEHFDARFSVEPATQVTKALGREKLYDSEGRKYRGKLYSRIHYYKTMIKRLEADETPKGKRKIRNYEKKIKEVQKELEEHERRHRP